MTARDPMSHPPRVRTALLPLAIAVACIPAVGQAQQDPQTPAPAADEEMVVVGQSAQLRRALADQRDADNLQTIVHSDGINSLPDSNASEALQRLPGLSIERDQGEGRFVRVRGTAPNLNNTTIDGVRVPAPEDDQRAVALDVLPSDLIDSLVVTKALTPDMDADAVGGSIDVRSVSALDKEGPFYKVSGQGSHNDLTDETSPKLAVSGGRTFNVAGGRLGVAAAVSYEDRDFGSDNIETGGSWDFEGDTPGFDEIEQRDYTSINRERTGLALNLDFEQDAANRYHFRTMYSEFTDDEQRNANVIEFDDPLAPGGTADAEVERELKDRVETQEIFSAKAGGEHIIDSWTLEYEASYSEASEEEGPDELAMGEAIFTPIDSIQGVSYSGTKRPRLNLPDNFYDDANFELDEAELEHGDVTDEEVGFKVDFKRDFVVNTNPASVKFGAKRTERTKERDITLYAFDGDDLGNPTADNFTNGEADWRFGRFGNTFNPGAVREELANLDLESNLDEEESQIEDFRIDEDISAGYLMGTLDIDDLRLIGGVRYEDTSLEGRGSRFENDTFTTETATNDYGNLLGSLHARYQLTDRTLIRSSFTQSLARPVFEELSPAIIIDGDEAEFGNPNLDPLEADNLDLGIEHYISDTSAVSAHLFYKDIKNFIFETDLAGTGQTRRGLNMNDFDEAATFENGDDADLMGLELAGSHQFASLPGVLGGVLVNANVTLTDSDASITGFNADEGRFESRDIDLPGQSDVTGNLSLGYEDRNLSMRLAGNYKSEYLLETGDPLESTGDIYQSDHFQLDFSSSYYVTNELQVSFEVTNINDRPYYAYQNREAYNAQHEEYGRTYRLGVTYASF
ncbi:TonB-dependent receptor [Halovibrio salipaludis]|uniref:TonB-dependent receptor n=1 Tax=Halovibrio salipaludis TaxID=2032626 RepID=A0A2A2F4U9_9GAMM|nr:TonB-dependent receptor [Halovibrio salipaludis]PAU79697.1 TonB-dependent receptor [Halovibrio salipaludis]